ncbi:MAG: nucleotide disphospho-sugar-binding domain-containing protein [Acidimicrobiia bacterium]
MADIVFLAHGLTSPLNASLALCKRLRAQGHVITYVSHADLQTVVEANGFAFVRLSADERIRERTETLSRSNPARWASEMRAARAESASLPEMVEVVASIDPDLVIADIETHYAIIATATLQLPTILVMNWFSIFERPGLPPPGSAHIPDGTAEDARAAEREWRGVRARSVIDRTRHKLGRGGVGDVLRPIGYGTYHYADLKTVATTRGYPLDRETDRTQWLRPYTYTQYPILCFNAFEMELPHEPPANLRYVGPMVDMDREEPRLSGDALGRWEALKARRGSDESDRPLVYCSLGSYWADLEFLQMIVNTFVRRPEWDLVLGLGEQTSLGDFGDLPDNITLLEWAPQLEVLAEADVAINHAGVTSVNECLLFGVPIIAYSPDLTDQDGVAARIAYHRVGIAAEWDTTNPRLLEQHVERLLDDESFRSNVQAMGSQLQRYAQEQTAERLISRFLETGELVDQPPRPADG